MESDGYDDAFNDGLFRGAVSAGSRGTPHNWPRSVSELRGRTHYLGQGMSADDVSDGHYAHGAARPYARQAQLAQQPAPRMAATARRPGETSHSDFMLTRSRMHAGNVRGPFRFRP